MFLLKLLLMPHFALHGGVSTIVIIVIEKCSNNLAIQLLQLLHSPALEKVQEVRIRLLKDIPLADRYVALCTLGFISIL